MLNLECVEQKKEYKGSKWGGLLPISSLGSQHCSGVTIGGAQSAWCVLVLGKACCDRPPWVLSHDRGFPIAIEMARPVLQQRIQRCDSVWSFGVAIQSWCPDKAGLVGGVATSVCLFLHKLKTPQINIITRALHFS